MGNTFKLGSPTQLSNGNVHRHRSHCLKKRHKQSMMGDLEMGGQTTYWYCSSNVALILLRILASQWVLSSYLVCLGWGHIARKRSVHPECTNRSRKRKEKESSLTHSSTALFSLDVRLSLEHSVGSCCKRSVVPEPEPIEGVVANSSSRHCIHCFCIPRFLARVASQGPL